LDTVGDEKQNIRRKREIMWQTRIIPLFTYATASMPALRRQR
jgi:hypothetical protein